MAKILYFDDEIDSLLNSALEYLRKDCFHEVDEVSELTEAEKKIYNSKYDVLLLDIRILPEKRRNAKGYEDKDWRRTGVRLIERIRNGVINGASSKSVPIIVITAVMHPPTLIEIENKGAKGDAFIHVIQKPFRLADVQAAILAALNHGGVND